MSFNASSRRTFILRTCMTPCSLTSSRISSSLTPFKSGQRTTPLQVLKGACRDTCTFMLWNDFKRNRFSTCFLLVYFTSRSPERSFFFFLYFLAHQPCQSIFGGGRVVRRCWVNFQCRGVLLTWNTVGQGPIVLAVGAGGGCLDIFSLLYHFSFLSPSLWETARYRLKYCLKGPLSPKQQTNQQPINTFSITKGERLDIDLSSCE